MTVQELLEKHGETKVKFSSYYKYSFGFTGQIEDNLNIYLTVGGDSSEIYRLEVNADTEYTIKELSYYEIGYFTITDSEDKEIAEYTD